jgi:hypothetical protein
MGKGRVEGGKEGVMGKGRAEGERRKGVKVVELL